MGQPPDRRDDQHPFGRTPQFERAYDGTIIHNRPPWTGRLEAIRSQAGITLKNLFVASVALVALSGCVLVPNMLSLFGNFQLIDRYVGFEYRQVVIIAIAIVLMAVLLLISYLVCRSITTNITNNRYRQAWRWITYLDTGIMVADMSYWDRVFEQLEGAPAFKWINQPRPNNLDTQVKYAALNLRTFFEMARDSKVPGNNTYNSSCLYLTSRPACALVPLGCALSGMSIIFFLYLRSYGVLFLLLWWLISISSMHAHSVKILAVCDFLLHQPNVKYLEPGKAVADFTGGDVERLMHSSGPAIEKNPVAKKGSGKDYTKPAVPQYLAGTYDDDDD